MNTQTSFVKQRAFIDLAQSKSRIDSWEHKNALRIYKFNDMLWHMQYEWRETYWYASIQIKGHKNSKSPLSIQFTHLNDWSRHEDYCFIDNLKYHTKRPIEETIKFSVALAKHLGRPKLMVMDTLIASGPGTVNEYKITSNIYYLAINYSMGLGVPRGRSFYEQFGFTLASNKCVTAQQDAVAQLSEPSSAAKFLTSLRLFGTAIEKSLNDTPVQFYRYHHLSNYIEPLFYKEERSSMLSDIKATIRAKVGANDSIIDLFHNTDFAPHISPLMVRLFMKSSPFCAAKYEDSYIDLTNYIQMFKKLYLPGPYIVQ